MDLLTTGTVMEELGISRMTLYKWIDRKLISAFKATHGKRSFLMFDKREVLRVKAQMKPTRQKGKPLLKAKRKPQ